MLAKDTIAVPVGESFVLRAPHIDFFRAKDFPEEGIQLTPTDDVQRTIVYTTSALLGVKAVDAPLTELKEGQHVLLYDVSPNAPNRAGFRNVSTHNGQVLQGGLNAGAASPQFVWQLQRKDSHWQLFHPATQRYLPLLENSQNVVVSKTAGDFSITRNSDGNTWKVQGTNGIFWDGKEGAMTGWHTYGHPYRFHTFVAAPYFRLIVRYVDTAGKTLFPTEESLVPAGSAVTVVAPDLEGYRHKETTTSLSDLHRIDAHGMVTVVFESTNGISNINAGSDDQATLRNNVYYDLQGRRITHAQHGLFILNGQKLVKP